MAFSLGQPSSLDGTVTSTLQLLGHIHWHTIAALTYILHKITFRFTLAWFITSSFFTILGIGFGRAQRSREAENG